MTPHISPPNLKSGRLLLSIEGVVYDLSNFENHPGGKEIIELAATKADGTFLYNEAGHSKKAKHMMRKFQCDLSTDKEAAQVAAAAKIEAVEDSREKLNPHDLTAKNRESLFNIDIGRAKWLIRDKRDRVMAGLLIELLVIAIINVVLFFNPIGHVGSFLWGLFVISQYMGRYILFLHYTSHREAFQQTSFMEGVRNIFGVIFGMIPYAYHLHHVVMHHQENNVMPYDLSSTMPYQRNNPLHFLHYWARFQFGICIELPYYALKKGKYNLVAQTVCGIVCYFLSIKYIYAANPLFAIYQLLIPHLLANFMLMFGNWSQHAFISPTEPLSNYGLTYNIIEHEMNQICFNDGYHVLHHLHPKLHWSTLPKVFDSYRDAFDAKKSITIKNLDIFFIGLYLLSGNMEALASHSNVSKERLEECCQPFVFDTREQAFLPVGKAKVM